MKKNKKKSNGEGTIYEEKRGGRTYYRAQVVVGTKKRRNSIKKIILKL